MLPSQAWDFLSLRLRLLHSLTEQDPKHSAHLPFLEQWGWARQSPEVPSDNSIQLLCDSYITYKYRVDRTAWDRKLFWFHCKFQGIMRAF